eukprot:TRINITY_DN37289_c0_g1_i1.p1 TRINITY_DN37289_c0_g1~~TRINITY_DN37289_c0_g1_i1.p1  ORF type:complete len:332 (+),score=33.79 TRINITY_DN37289_c0_g1_i1:93-998(+)
MEIPAMLGKPSAKSHRVPTQEEQNEAARKIQRFFLVITARKRRNLRHEQLWHFAAKLGKKKGRKKELQKIMSVKYWIEAADPKHRYGSWLFPYYKAWLQSGSHMPFFAWLDEGPGSELDLAEAPRQQLMDSHVEYFDKAARDAWEVEFREEKSDVRLYFRSTGERITTPGNRTCCFCLYRYGVATKFIYVVDSDHKLYVHRKKKGHFHHSSFLGGKPALAAGGLVISDGKLLLVNGNSGHYKPSAKMLKKTFKQYELAHGLSRASYILVHPRTVKPCGCKCCPVEVPPNAPCCCQLFSHVT